MRPRQTNQGQKRITYSYDIQKQEVVPKLDTCMGFTTAWPMAEIGTHGVLTFSFLLFTLHAMSTPPRVAVANAPQ